MSEAGRKLTVPTVRELRFAAADQHLAIAKGMFSTAALACLRGTADAEAQVRAALDAVDQARAALRAVCDDDSE